MGKGRQRGHKQPSGNHQSLNLHGQKAPPSEDYYIESSLYVLAQPAVDELDHLLAVAVEKHFMHVAVNAGVFQTDEVIFRARLVEPLRNANVEYTMIRTLGGNREDVHSLETRQLVDRLVLHVAADFVARPFRRLQMHFDV